MEDLIKLAADLTLAVMSITAGEVSATAAGVSTGTLHHQERRGLEEAPAIGPAPAVGTSTSLVGSPGDPPRVLVPETKG